MFNVWSYTECCICKEGMYLQRRDHDTWRINWNPDIYIICKIEDIFRVLFRDTTYHEITNVASYQTLYNIWDVMYTRSRTCNVLKVDPCLISEATMLILSCYLSREGAMPSRRWWSDLTRFWKRVPRLGYKVSMCAARGVGDSSYGRYMGSDVRCLGWEEDSEKKCPCYRMVATL